VAPSSVIKRTFRECLSCVKLKGKSVRTSVVQQQFYVEDEVIDRLSYILLRGKESEE
jgi:hypothetical protein